MRINTNMMALNAQNKLTVNQGNVEKAIQKLSSGLRINSAADDAAGLAISEKMRSQIRGLGQAQDNAQDGISLIQTAEGALQQTTDILQRMRELVIKAQNTGVLTDNDRTSISSELSTLRDEVDRIATSTTFNSKKLLNGELGNALAKKANGDYDVTVSAYSRIDVSNAIAGEKYTIKSTLTKGGRIEMNWDEEIDGKTVYHTAYSDVSFGPNATSVSGRVNFAGAGIIVDFGSKAILGSIAGDINVANDPKHAKADFKIGANTYVEDVLSCGIADMSSIGLNRDMKKDEEFGIDISTAKDANETLANLDYALEAVAQQRATLGVMQNRMEYAVSNLSTTEENLSAAESRIRDVDMAEEMVGYTKNNILNQSAMAMLAQANQQPQAILSLLQ